MQTIHLHFRYHASKEHTGFDSRTGDRDPTGRAPGPSAEGTRLNSGRAGRTYGHYPDSASLTMSAGSYASTPYMIVRFANALDVTTDDLLQPKGTRTTAAAPSRSLRVQRRMEKIEKLPPHQQNYLLKTIDGFLKGVAS